MFRHGLGDSGQGVMQKDNGQSSETLFNRKTSSCIGKEDIVFKIFMIVMAVYYGLRVFMITPWYDELYTYYWFISRGPAYAAIHWPLPNNHVGYSVLSSILMITHNGYIALRGVSFAAALLNLYFLHKILKDAFDSKVSFIGTLFYAGLGSIMSLAVQGRGYTLSITCMLLMILGLQKIMSGDGTRKDYVFTGVGAVLGLYTVPSSLYYVIVIFIGAGFILLLENKRKELGKTVICAVISAMVTFALYSIIWLAVGSNLLVKDQSGSYFGMSHVNVIIKVFPAAWKSGLDYMLASPYIQSIPRAGFTGKLISWFTTEMTEMSGMNGTFTAVILLICIIVANISIFYKRPVNRRKNTSVETDITKECGSTDRRLIILADIGMIGSIIMMIVQAKLPYYRVFAFWGVYIAIFISGAIFYIYKRCGKAIYLLFAIAAVAMIRNMPFHSYQYGEREDQIADALRKTYIAGNTDNTDNTGTETGNTGTKDNGDRHRNAAVTDCEQQYLMKFMYRDVCENTNVTGCGYVIFDKELADGSDSKWEYMTDHDSIDWDYVKESMKEIYENKDFIVYSLQ